MGMFIDPNETVPVTDAKGNTIWIKAKLTFADYAKVEDALMRLRIDTAGGKRGKGVDTKVDAHITQSAQQAALLVECVKRWDGPDFVGVACTPANIAVLNPLEPIVIDVLEEIDRLNEAPTEPPPNGNPSVDPIPDEQPI